MRASSRASGAPRQKWMPDPKATWSLGLRVTWKRSGPVELAVIAVAGRVQHHHHRALRDGLAVHLDVGLGAPPAGRRES